MTSSLCQVPHLHKAPLMPYNSDCSDIHKGQIFCNMTELCSYTHSLSCLITDLTIVISVCPVCNSYLNLECK